MPRLVGLASVRIGTATQKCVYKQPPCALMGGNSHAAGVVDPKFATTAMSALRFGLPTSITLLDGSVMDAFWCVEDAVSVIRSFKISI